MTTNHRKMRILLILDKIIAYLCNQSQEKKNHKFKKISCEKITIFQLSAVKKVQNLTIFGEKIAFLRNQIAKNQLKKKCAFQRPSRKMGSLYWFSEK